VTTGDSTLTRRSVGTSITALGLGLGLGTAEPAHARAAQESGNSGNTVNFTARVTSHASQTSRATSILRRVRTVALGLTSVALTALFVFPASLPAAADPPLTAAEARAVIEQLETDAAAIDQQYAGVKEEIKQGRAQLELKQADVKAQTDKVARMKLQVGQVALAQFQNRSLDTAAHLFVTPDTDRFLSQISTVQKVSENQNSALQDFQQAQGDLAALEHSAKTDLAALAEKEKQLKSLTEASDKKIAQAKKVLAKLTASQRKQISDAEKKEAARSSAATSRGSTRSSVTGSGRGAQALAYAKAQLGEPYVRNGDGPSSWDCSGLTMRAWESVGVSLPHSAGQQFNRGSSVAKSDLQLGDLVFFYSDISHVGLYAGNGQVIHAPRPGKYVEYIKMSYMPYAGARRPG
jgi:cell wall-associated NlpC family hydrolase